MRWAKWAVAAGLGWILSSIPASAAADLKGEIKVSSGIRPADLIVYILNPPARPRLAPAPTAIMDQKNQAFHPHVLAVVKGSTVRFLNSDRVAHNIFSVSPAMSFDLGRFLPKTFTEVTFEKPGVVEILCGFHSRMLAYIRVMEHPYFAIPDAEGRFTIRGVPPGTYLLRVWHEASGEISKKIELKTGRSEPTKIRFPK